MIRFDNQAAYESYKKLYNHYTNRIRDCERFIDHYNPKYESLWALGRKKEAIKLSSRIQRIIDFKGELERFFYLQEWGTATGHTMSVITYPSSAEREDYHFEGIAKRPLFDEYGQPDGEKNYMTFGFINHGRNWRNPSWSMHT